MGSCPFYVMLGPFSVRGETAENGAPFIPSLAVRSLAFLCHQGDRKPE